MNKRNRTKPVILTVLVIALITGAFFGGLKLGENKGYDKGANSPKVAEAMYAKFEMGYELDTYKTVNASLTEERDKLINDYNNLVDRYNSLARTPAYKSISCTTNTIGTLYQTTYTTCY
jgi:hypothetical protein